jgi:beta-glucanase (GH16 family)
MVRKTGLFFCALASALAISGCMFVPPTDSTSAISLNSRTLVWSDEFNQTASTDPDTSKWNYETGAGGWGNNEVEYYTTSRNNSWVDNGTLKIKAIKDSSMGSGSTWTSARLTSKLKGDWTYGYFEARIKLPPGYGTWPAFWMMPTDSVYGTWPKSGELDIMEHAPATSGLNHVYGTVHYFGTDGSGHVWTSLGSTTDTTATTAFHTYGVEWTSSAITLYYDGVMVGSAYPKFGDYTTWPFDRQFYFILNLAMGGNLGGTIDPALTSATYEIDYVRVYQ